MTKREGSAETIKNNAVTHLLLGGAGLQETRYYSERIGDTTVQTASATTGGQNSFMQGETRRRLMAPEELRTMPENTLLMVSKASPPLLTLFTGR
jgi:type IV secretory pathway TraG/TraD family ATPase VirD4